MTQNKDESQKYWDEGWAATYGSENPYEKDTIEALAWDDGYCAKHWLDIYS